MGHFFLQAFSTACCLVAVFAKVSRTLTDVVTTYDMLRKADIDHHIVRRSSEPGDHIRHIKFVSHQRLFRLTLEPHNTIFAPGFTAVTVDANGKEHQFVLDQSAYYKGFVEGDHYSKVEAQIEDELLTASIRTANETYVIEPMRNHVLDEERSHDMIVYRASDVRSNITNYNGSKEQPSFCGVRDTHSSDAIHAMFAKDDLQSGPNASHPRLRRSIPEKNSCSLTLVGDYLFYMHVGQKSTTTAINYMIGVIQRIDPYFRKTRWTSSGSSSEITGVGFQIEKVKVHTEFSQTGYNKEVSGAWNVEMLLTAFSRETWKTCLSHLFTYQDFAKGVIGLAYVASESQFDVGGICSPSYSDLEGARELRCGLSSSENWGRRLLTLEADLVTAHELGHNFGSNHDPEERRECVPSSSDGGKYIMYATSVSGTKVNNMEFSKCSKESIYKVLTSKMGWCFKEQNSSLCGNFKVESPEECDPGFEAVQAAGDSCCTAGCRLKPGATCSDANSQCCRNCKYKSGTEPCREAFLETCQAITYCTGWKADCPAYPKAPDNTPCSRGGRCRSGDCIGLCELNQREPCFCSGASVCKICCVNPVGGACQAFAFPNGSTINEVDGLPCDAVGGFGSCIGGLCKRTRVSAGDEFSALLKDFTVAAFVRFMQANIVGTILVFSLIIWIPASLVVHLFDRRRAKEIEAMKAWQNPSNRTLLRQSSDTGKKNKLMFTISHESGSAKKVHGQPSLIRPADKVSRNRYVVDRPSDSKQLPSASSDGQMVARTAKRVEEDHDGFGGNWMSDVESLKQSILTPSPKAKRTRDPVT